jgi:serine phosphatase RsbU (regulator of sigma subunit)
VDLSAARILVVDDNADNRDVLVRRLQRLQFEHVVQANDGVQALAHLRASAFDLMLLDVMMPNMNGIEVLEVMKADGLIEVTPVVMISAASEIDTVVRCIGLGADDYLPKPFNPALLAARVKAVLEKKFLRAENRRQFERFQRELAEARDHQLAMLPKTFAVGGGAVDAYALSDPALEVGGDLYDVFEVSPDVLCIAVGDVAGKGAAAGLFMARARSLLRGATLQFRAITGETPKPSDIAGLMNDELCKNNPQFTFITLFLGFLDLPTGRLTYCNAGHVFPIVASATSVKEIANEPQPALGVLDNMVFADGELLLDVGELLVLPSDGLADMLNPDAESFGLERLLATIGDIAHAPAADIVNQVMAKALSFAGGRDQFDDITMLALRRLR